MTDSGLDLSASPAQAATTTLTPPAAQSDLRLIPPAPVAKVEPAKAGTMVPLDAAKAAELHTKASAFVRELTALDPHSAEFQKKVSDITSMGVQEIRASSEASNRMLSRPVQALAASKGEGRDSDAQQKVAKSLVDLRRQVEDLDPAQAQSGVKKFLGLIPFGDTLRDYFAKYQSAQKHLDRIVEALKSGQDELTKDNVAIEGEKQNLWVTMGRLQEYATLTEALDAAVAAEVAVLEVSDPERAKVLKSDVLFAIRQKHQDLLTQLAVAVQGYLALDLVRKNNTELIKGVDRATTTTLAALRTAVIVAQALANQKLVLDQITALNATTSSMIETTAEMLSQQTAQINQQAASSTVSIDSLKRAFANVYATMDAIDTFKVQAVDSMAVTVSALQGEITTAAAYVERVRSAEEASQR